MAKTMTYQSAVAAVIGLIGSLVFSLLIDGEIVGGVALVVAPLLVTSVVLVFILEAVSANNGVKIAAFVSPLILVVGATAYAMWVELHAVTATGVSDGGGDIARFMLKAYLVGLAIAFVCLIALARRRGALRS